MKIQTSKRRTAKGFTITELMVTTLLSTIVVLSMSSIMADNHKGYNHLNTVVYGDVAQDGFVARMMFDQICRKASIRQCVVGENVLKVFFYSDPALNLSGPDRYALFHLDVNDELKVYLGQWDHDTSTTSLPQSIETLASNVSSVSFGTVGLCVQMNLEIDNGSQSAMVVCSSVRHNP